MVLQAAVFVIPALLVLGGCDPSCPEQVIVEDATPCWCEVQAEVIESIADAPLCDHKHISQRL